MKQLLALALIYQIAFASDAPKFGWKQVSIETFALRPAAHKKYFPLSKGRWKFEFQAEMAIYTAVLTPAQSKRLLPLAEYKRLPCNQLSVLESQAECNVAIPRAFLVIRDKRGLGSEAMAAGEVVLVGRRLSLTRTLGRRTIESK